MLTRLLQISVSILYILFINVHAQTTTSTNEQVSDKIEKLFPSGNKSRDYHVVHFENFRIVCIYSDKKIACAFFIPYGTNKLSEEDLKNEAEAFASLLGQQEHNILSFGSPQNRCFMLCYPSILKNASSQDQYYLIENSCAEAIDQISKSGTVAPIAWQNDAPVWQLPSINNNAARITFRINARFVDYYTIFIENSRPTTKVLYNYMMDLTSESFEKDTSTSPPKLRGMRIIARSQATEAYLVTASSSKGSTFIYRVGQSNILYQLSVRNTKEATAFAALAHPEKQDTQTPSMIAGTQLLAASAAPATAPQETKEQLNEAKGNYTKKTAMDAWLKELVEP